MELRNRVTRLCAVTLTMAMTLAAAQAQAPPEGSGLGAACPEPMNKFFGHFVMASALAFVADREREQKNEKTCWVAGPSASGQNRVESQSGEDAMAAEYSYTIGPAGISASSNIRGQHNSDRGGGGQGSSMLWLMWHDTLTFHSSQIPLIDPNDYRLGHPPTPEQLAETMIHFEVRLLQDSPQCSGLKEPHFKYLTGVAGVVRDIGGGAAIIAPGGAPPGATAENWLLRAGSCGIPAGSVTAQVPNGQSVAVHVTVQENLLGSTDGDSRAGNLKVELSAERLCVVRPAKPSDLTITAASGGDYWCP